jgi:hypothetical protein
MPSTLLRSAAAVTLAACACALAQAQTAPPIKPGLWQVTPQPTADGQPGPGAHLKNMPPEVRKQVEASMKARGVDMGGSDGSMKICHTRESLDQGQWQGQQGSCKTAFKTRSASTWAWHSTCAQPPMEIDGEANFTNTENYAVKTSTTMTLNGQKRTSQNVLSAKWLGANCGGLKPMVPPPAAK